MSHVIMPMIRAIAAEPGRSEKERMLTLLTDDPLGSWIIRMTYDPFINYGVKPDPAWMKLDEGGRDFRRDEMELLLMQLANRELTGNAASETLKGAFTVLKDDPREILIRILSKDLKCGIGETTILKVSPGLIPVFAVMRAQTFEEGKIKTWPWKGEYKLDGQRNTFLCRDGFGAFYTRSGKPVPALDFIVPSILKVAHQAVGTDLEYVIQEPESTRISFMLDGEAMMGLFGDTGALRRKDTKAIGAELHLYDMMSYADFDAVGSVGEPQAKRRENVRKFVDLAKKVLTGAEQQMLQVVPQFFVNNDAEAVELFLKSRTKTLASYLARGDKTREEELLLTTIDKATGKPKVLEGVMLKNPKGLYDKKKSTGWLKIKAADSLDLEIVGAFPGEPMTKYADCLGGLVLNHKGVRVRVGGGFSDEERRDIWDLFLKDRAASTFWTADKDAVIFTGLTNSPQRLIGRLGEVEFNEVTPDKSLRHPRWVRFRDDKQGEIEDKEKHVRAA